jgi:integration host factor subunit alpha
MSALTKADLVEHLHEIMGLNKREAKDLIEAFFKQIELALMDGRHVRISGFGNFELRDKRARPGRNPKTGEEVEISARRVVTFKPSQKLKGSVEDFFKQQGDQGNEESETY